MVLAVCTMFVVCVCLTLNRTLDYFTEQYSMQMSRRTVTMSRVYSRRCPRDICQVISTIDVIVNIANADFIAA